MQQRIRRALIGLLFGRLVSGRFRSKASNLCLPRRLADYIQDEVIVRFRPEASRARRDAAISAAGGRVRRLYPELETERLQLDGSQTVLAAITILERDSEVLSAEPNFIRRIVGTNDPRWIDGSLWGLRKIQAETAWTIGTGSSDIVVADLDTGVNYSHPDLTANMWRNPGEIPGNHVDDDRNGYVDDVVGIDTINNDSDPMDDHGHGTHTAGTIGPRATTA